jgi:hypothetical protein
VSYRLVLEEETVMTTKLSWPPLMLSQMAMPMLVQADHTPPDLLAKV